MEYEALKQPVLTRPPRKDVYTFHAFTEQTAPELVSDAWRIHAEGYEHMGFVNHDAIDEKGYLRQDIDKSRGSMVQYYVGLEPTTENNKGSEAVVSTLRKVSIPIAGTLNDLPAYQLCKEALYPEELEMLNGIKNPHLGVKEIGAFAVSPEVGPMAGFEMLRHAQQEGAANNEIWFFSIVATTYQSLVENFGTEAIRQIGYPVSLHNEGVSKGIELVPALVDTARFLQYVYESAMAEENAEARNKKLRSFIFFSEGLGKDEMSDQVNTAREFVLNQIKSATK